MWRASRHLAIIRILQLPDCKVNTFSCPMLAQGHWRLFVASAGPAGAACHGLIEIWTLCTSDSSLAHDKLVLFLCVFHCFIFIKCIVYTYADCCAQDMLDCRCNASGCKKGPHLPSVLLSCLLCTGSCFRCCSPIGVIASPAWI